MVYNDLMQPEKSEWWSQFTAEEIELFNEEWIRLIHFNFFDEQGRIDSIERMRHYLNDSSEQIAEFRTLPVWKWWSRKPGFEWLKEL